LIYPTEIAQRAQGGKKRKCFLVEFFKNFQSNGDQPWIAVYKTSRKQYQEKLQALPQWEKQSE